MTHFIGSGTALYEAMEVFSNVKLVGCDINPLANLITKVKLQGINHKEIYKDIESIKININSPYKKFWFFNIDKWFRDDIIEELSKIRNAIIMIRDDKNRLYFWYMLSDIIRKYSNTRSSTYKLHIKEKAKIDNLQNNLICDYINSIEENIVMFNKSNSEFQLYKSDVLEKIKDFKDRSFDITITSPPYGDNNTTVPYGQFSMLSLYWIDKKDLELEGWELDNYSKIDSRSMGGTSKKINIDKEDIKLIRPYTDKISDIKKRKVLKFFSDYFIFLKELCRVTDKKIIMTLGNRTVDRININLTEITIKYLEREGFKHISTMERTIPIKRIPNKTSKVNSLSVSSMNDEYVIIHDRKI